MEVLVLPRILALVLGDMAETAFRQSMLLSGGSVGIFFGNPLVGSIVTLALASILSIVIIGQQGVTGGVNGITGFQTVLGISLNSRHTQAVLYYITVILVLAVVLAGRFILSSRLGKILVAIRDREVTQGDVEHVIDAAKAVAIPALAHRLTLRPELWVQRVRGEDVVAEALDRGIEQGVYKLSPSMTMNAIIQKLQIGLGDTGIAVGYEKMRDGVGKMDEIRGRIFTVLRG